MLCRTTFMYIMMEVWNKRLFNIKLTLQSAVLSIEMLPDGLLTKSL